MKPLKSTKMRSKKLHLSHHKRVYAKSGLVKSVSVVFEKGVGAPRNE